MIFNTWVYGAFLAVVFLVHWLAPARVRAPLLIAAGLWFYGFYYLPHLALVAGLTVVVWLLAHGVAPEAGRRRQLVFFCGVAGCLSTLAYFKYQGLFFDWLAWVRGADVRAGAPPSIRPPLAISFFTFEYIHYLIEVFRGGFGPASLRDFGLFVFFFPTLVCGPIKRFGAFHAQEEIPRRLDAASVQDGLGRILVGLAKKTLIADQLAPHAAPVLLAPAGRDAVALWIALYAYALQIYFDFAGYSDIAIGSARLLGYIVPENFDFPYLQPNIARFWRAWHISLTSWITDYVYIPLGGSRRGAWSAAWNRLVAMTLCGLWHGAALHFAVWGLYHGIALNVHRAFARSREVTERLGAARRALGVAVTFHVVCIGWVLFVCDLRTARVVLARLFGVGG